MRLLLDTHTLILAVDDPTQLGVRAAAELRDLGNDLLLGARNFFALDPAGQFVFGATSAGQAVFAPLGGGPLIGVATSVADAQWVPSANGVSTEETPSRFSAAREESATPRSA